MSMPALYGGIGSLVVGLLFVAFPGFIGLNFNRFGSFSHERHKDSVVGKMRAETRKLFPAFSPDYNDEVKTKKTVRILGVVFLIQSVVFLILSAVMSASAAESLPLTNFSDAKLIQSGISKNPARKAPTDKLAGQPPDILSATNLEQWLALIKDLKQDKSLPRHWSTARFRAGSPPVLLKHNGQSIVFAAQAVDVSTLPKTQEFMEAEIYSPPMNMAETRELGLKLCSMFGFDVGKFLAWSNEASGNWLDASMFSETDSAHLNFLKVRKSFNNEQPWYIIFSTSSESAVSKLMGKPY